jgi:hypothetical protein
VANFNLKKNGLNGSPGQGGEPNPVMGTGFFVFENPSDRARLSPLPIRLEHNLERPLKGNFLMKDPFSSFSG